MACYRAPLDSWRQMSLDSVQFHTRDFQSAECTVSVCRHLIYIADNCWKSQTQMVSVNSDLIPEGTTKQNYYKKELGLSSEVPTDQRREIYRQ